MKRWKSLTAALCAVVLLCGFSVPAYAYADGGEGADYGDSTMTEETPAPEPTIEPGEGFSEEGNLVTRDLLYDEHTNKQFITVQTSGGNTFYIVIDYDKPVDEEGEQYETYFFSVVDEADLLAAAEAAGVEQAVCSCSEKCAAGAVNTDCAVCAVNMTECAGVEPEPEPEPEPEEPDSPFTTVDASYFDDALFIGDSHTDGFKDYAGLPNADYLCHNGLTVWSAVEKAEFPGRQTLAQALRGKHYGKIYLMLGINELGAGTAESWAAQYKVLLDEIRELQPDAIIFLQAIFHTTQEKSDATFFKNSTIDARNAELQKLADNETVFYIDCNPVFDDDTGALTAEYSGDGVHVKAPYYVMWRDYLFQFGVVR